MVDILKLRKMSDNKIENDKKNDSNDGQVPKAPDKEFKTKINSEKPIPAAVKSNTEMPEKPAAVKKAPETKPSNPISSSEGVNADMDKIKRSKEKSSVSDEEAKALDLIIFSLADRLFGIDIIKVQEVVRFNEITRVPNAAKFVLGVMNLRGNITPVIDLHKRFSLPEAEWSEKTRIIVLQIQNQAIGFLVDHVSEIMHTYVSDINSAPGMHAGIGTDYISGVVKIKSKSADDDGNKLMILLNLENILEESSVTLT